MYKFVLLLIIYYLSYVACDTVNPWHHLTWLLTVQKKMFFFFLLVYKKKKDLIL